MPWNANWPVGNISVKANRTPGNQNTLYIAATMGSSAVGTNTSAVRDHFWNVGGNEDGRHRFMCSPGFTVGGNPANPVVGAGMDATLFLKKTNNEFQWFNLNSSVTSSGSNYQVSPNFIQGTVVLNGVFVTVTPIPANVYGEIIMWTTALGRFTAQNGFFRSGAALVESWANYLAPEGASETIALKFANGSDSTGKGLNINARTSAASNGLTWNYRIIYRAI